MSTKLIEIINYFESDQARSEYTIFYREELQNMTRIMQAEMWLSKCDSQFEWY